MEPTPTQEPHGATGAQPLIRPVPPLSPNSSLRRAVDLLRAAGAASVAVVNERGAYLGSVSSSALAAAASGRNLDLNGPAFGLMEIGDRTARVTGGPGDAEAVLAGTAATSSVIVVDASGRYVGIAYLPDQLAPAPDKPMTAPSPAGIPPLQAMAPGTMVPKRPMTRVRRVTGCRQKHSGRVLLPIIPKRTWAHFQTAPRITAPGKNSETT